MKRKIRYTVTLPQDS